METKKPIERVEECAPLQVITGCMFSHKSSELIRRIARYRISGRRCYVINYAGDTRFTTTANVATHDKKILETNATCRRLSEIKEEELKDVDCVFLDESQFFPDIVEFCEALIAKGKMCVVAALKADYRGEPWPAIARLIAKADKHDMLTAVCMMCGYDGAAHSRRISSDVGKEVIGGIDKYIATCRKCFTREDISLSTTTSSATTPTLVI